LFFSLSIFFLYFIVFLFFFYSSGDHLYLHSFPTRRSSDLFIFSIIGEELGFLGAVAIVALFMVLVWRGLRIGLRAPDPFGAYLALGITVLIAIQTLVNLGVVMGLLPTKGLPLPFISFGGSALLVTMLSTGVLLNISQHAHV